MPRPPKDLAGKRFSRLIAIRQIHVEYDKQHAFWECKCDCGKMVIARKDSLESGHAKSCGCMLDERNLQSQGLGDTRAYHIWLGMKDRCLNKRSNAYKSYGGRGISICNEWLNNFKSFYDWSVENGYDEEKGGHNNSIDRIDVNGNYEPSNCRWATSEVQNYNKRGTVVVDICGEQKTLLEISREYEIPISLVRSRYRRYAKNECTIEELLSKDKILERPSNSFYITIDGITKNLTEWERETGISRKTISNRYKKGARTRNELFKKGRK